MNKKGKKNIYKYLLLTCAIICVAVVLLWGVVFATDYIRVSSFKEPIFVVAVDETSDDSGSRTYKGLGYTVEVEKYTDAERGEILISVEMWMFGRIITAVIT